MGKFKNENLYLFQKRERDAKNTSYIISLMEEINFNSRQKLLNFPKYHFDNKGNYTLNDSNEDCFHKEAIELSRCITEQLARLIQMGIIDPFPSF